MAKDVVFAHKDLWLNYQNAKDFLVVTGNELMINYNPYTTEISRMTFYMGQKLKLVKKKSL